MDLKCLNIELQRVLPEWEGEIATALEGVASLADGWGVTVERVLAGATCSICLAGVRDGQKVVIRAPLAEEERTSGLAALRAYAELGGVPVLECHEHSGTTLMPLLCPGTNLDEADLSDEERLAVAAKLATKLHRAENFGVWTHERWFQELWTFELPKGSAVNRELFEIGRTRARQLLESTCERAVLHGDLHHYNILQNGSEWVAIDPKGVYADPAFEPVAFLRNPIHTLAEDLHLVQTQARRVQLLVDLMNLSAERIWGWAVAQISLDAAWSSGEWSEKWAKIALATYEAGYLLGCK